MILPSAATLRVFHSAQLRRFGGAPGIRDENLLDAAVGRVQSALAYGNLDAVDAASMLCHAILKNHAFVDGNKRTAYGALIMTLAGNGLRLEADDMEIADIIVSAAGATSGYESLADWVRLRVIPLETDP